MSTILVNNIKDTGNNTLLTSDGSGNVTLDNQAFKSLPLFSVSRNSVQALTQNVWQKINFNAERYDTNNCFDSTTNYRFTPTISGHYMFNGNINFGTGTTTDSRVSLYKNGSLTVSGTAIGATNSNGTPFVGQAYANGTTDYFELFAYTGASGNSLYGDGSLNYTTFQGYRIIGT